MIEDWYRRRSDEVQTAFDVLREYLEHACPLFSQQVHATFGRG